MKIYTKQGDQGKTTLGNQDRVSKSDPRLDLTGSLDELNGMLGISVSLLREKPETMELGLEIQEVQRILFILGADLSGFSGKHNGPRIEKQHIVFLENRIDAMTDQIPPLQQFILPGGQGASGYLHVARAICRRLEVSLVRMLEIEHSNFRLNELDLPFVNRLSDYLFTAARFACHRTGCEEKTVSI